MMTFNHGLSGYVCSQVAMPVLRRRAPLPERAIAWAFFLGAMLPDMDIGVRLLVGRSAYFSGAWYGHRGLSHSLLGTLLLALAAAALLYRPLLRGPAGAAARAQPRQAFAWLVACCWAGGLLHIFGDLFTPGWQMPVFWPLAGRFGAWRHIGWFSPYLLWLFLLAVALASLARSLLARTPGLRPWAPRVAWTVYGLAAARWVSFLVQSRYTTWEEWMATQQALLPDALVGPVVQGVGVLWRWFSG